MIDDYAFLHRQATRQPEINVYDFDFKRVARVMQFDNWQVYDRGKMLVPDAAMLEVTARKLLRRLTDELGDEDGMVSSQGLVALRLHGVTRLMFVFEQSGDSDD